MILDYLLKFSEAQAITAAAASDYSIPLDDVRDIGTGKELYVALVVTTAFTDSGSNSTLTVALEGDSTSTFTPDATRDLFTIPALAAVGDTFYARLNPAGGPENQKYIQLKYTPNNGDLSGGAVSAYLVDNVHQVKLYAKNYTIS